MEALARLIEQAFEDRATLSPASAPDTIRAAVDETLGLLDTGKLRVAEKKDGVWVANEWAKKAVLLSFRLNDNVVMDGGHTQYFDKVPSKFAGLGEADFRQIGARIVPPAIARRGS